MGHRPLYSIKVTDEPEKPSRSQGHVGLWYDKFCNEWRKSDGFWHLDRQKQYWISSITQEIGDSALIKEAVSRLEALVEARAGRLLHMQTTSRFVTGLGRSHPVENGFAWHPILGTPYLPGSSVKGLVRAWAWEVGVEEPLIRRLLGPEAEEKKLAVGEWIFFDALPLKRIKLDMDIMTPHYGPYYANPKENPPLDRYNPNPIPLLTVAAGQPFVFAVAPRLTMRNVEEQERMEQDQQMVMTWLQDALEWFGAGAKTAVGYGRFKVNTVNRQNEKQNKSKRRSNGGGNHSHRYNE